MGTTEEATDINKKTFLAQSRCFGIFYNACHPAEMEMWKYPSAEQWELRKND